MLLNLRRFRWAVGAATSGDIYKYALQEIGYHLLLGKNTRSRTDVLPGRITIYASRTGEYGYGRSMPIRPRLGAACSPLDVRSLAPLFLPLPAFLRSSIPQSNPETTADWDSRPQDRIITAQAAPEEAVAQCGAVIQGGYPYIGWRYVVRGWYDALVRAAIDWCHGG